MNDADIQWLKQSTKASGVPLKVQDAATVDAIVTLLKAVLNASKQS